MATSEAPELIGLAQRTLRDLRLRVAGASGGGPDALREAGYAGATSLFDAFETWLSDQGSDRAEDLPIDEFSVGHACLVRHAPSFPGNPRDANKIVVFVTRILR